MSTKDTRDQARKNHLLAALPAEEFGLINEKLRYIELELGTSIYEFGDTMDHIYFPTTAIVSMLYVMENGGTAEIGIAGNNGLVGYPLFMGGETTSSRAIVQIAGGAVRMTAEDGKAAFARGGIFQNILLRYVQSLITQISQTAVCNRLHSLEKQLAKWLLINHDMLQADKLVMTHDLIADMLGVRREGVSVAAGNLQRLGVIKYARGVIEVLDRKKLESVSCECYKVVAEEYDRLLGDYIPTNR